MSDYTKATNFTAKDSLPAGNAAKVVMGAEIDDEFDAIAAAIATKANVASPALTGTPTAPTAAADTNTTQIATTAYVQTELNNLSATNLTSGTVPDARFPATLPAASGANLTALNASNVASGTLGNTYLPATIDKTTVKAKQFGTAEYNAGNSSTAITIDGSNGQNQKMTLTGNCAVTLSNGVEGQTTKLKVLTGAGSFSVTFSTAVNWPGGSAYAATQTASAVDFVFLYYDGSEWWGQFAKDWS